MRSILYLVIFCLSISNALAKNVQAKKSPQLQDFNQKFIQKFIAKTVQQDGFNKIELKKIFSQVKFKQSIIDAINKPAENYPWWRYRKIFINDKRIKNGVAFMAKYKKYLLSAQKKYHVPASIITAIIGVETLYGANKGNYRAIDALSTLSFSNYRRQDFFQRELRAFLNFHRQYKIDFFTTKSSYAGALGYPQFMPSSIKHYAVDFNTDKKIEFIANPIDAIGSIANYLHKFRWQKDTSVAVLLKIKSKANVEKITESIKPNLKENDIYTKLFSPTKKLINTTGKKVGVIKLQNKNKLEYWAVYWNYYAITRYNHSKLYAMAVFQLSSAIQNLSTHKN